MWNSTNRKLHELVQVDPLTMVNFGLSFLNEYHEVIAERNQSEMIATPRGWIPPSKHQVK